MLRAASDLQADFERVSGLRPALHLGQDTPAKTIIIVGTLGRSALIDSLAGSGKLDVRNIEGRWESFVMDVVAKPLPGVARALVVAGSDKRGATY